MTNLLRLGVIMYKFIDTLKVTTSYLDIFNHAQVCNKRLC
jgi:hypothetical protein